MNRIIKFRAFDSVNKEFRFADICETDEMSDWITWENPIDSPSNTGVGFDIDQYTGLKDKNGVEIYEGDICVNESGRVAKVIWFDSGSCFDFIALNEVGDSYGYSAHPARYKLSVIGNIYENKELLKG